MNRLFYSKRVQGFIDTAMGSIILFVCLSIPWSFGIVHNWSIATANLLSYLLVILACLRVVPGLLGEGRARPSRGMAASKRVATFLRVGLPLVAAGIVMLIYMVVAWANARATFSVETGQFSYFENYIRWLPHSYNAKETMREIWRCVGMLCFFFGTLTWIIGNPRESQSGPHQRSREFASGIGIPSRTLVLTKVIVFNAVLVGLVGIIQRLDGNEKLLWFYTTYRPDPKSHFGPFAYRGNAATFYNLIWPLAVFLIQCSMRRVALCRRFGASSDTLLYPAVFFLIIIPLILGSRAGFAVSITLLIILVGRHLLRERSWLAVAVVSGLVVIGSFAGKALGMDKTIERVVQTFRSGNIEERSLHRFNTYLTTLELIKERPIFGYGPGAFTAVYFMSRGLRTESTSNAELSIWDAWVHSDPLEFQLTFGLVGSVILGLIILFLSRWIWRLRKVDQSGNDRSVLFLGLFGFALHSLVDFPFQICGLTLMFVVVTACLVSSYDDRLAEGAR